ncbi:MAG: DUF4256 domain-containing protein [Candidatus Gracilibacteria bacterium]
MPKETEAPDTPADGPIQPVFQSENIVGTSLDSAPNEPEVIADGVADEVNATVEGAETSHELDPETRALLLEAVKANFDAHPERHKWTQWADFQRALEADADALLCLSRMQEAGHSPDKYLEDDTFYYFGTCTEEAPGVGRNTVYDQSAQEYLDTNFPVNEFPNEAHNGNAVGLAADMGADGLMPISHYEHLQTLGTFDAHTSSSLGNSRLPGRAPYGTRVSGYVYMDPALPSHLQKGSVRVDTCAGYVHREDQGCRVYKKVRKVPA